MERAIIRRAKSRLFAVIFLCLSGPLVAGPEAGDTLYTNPIIFADYSDPDVIRVGPAFYLISSSFNMTPGIPVLRSYDLVNWQIIGHAVAQLPDPVYALPQPGRGIWAPALRYRNGEFYIYYGDPDLGIFLVKGQSPDSWETPRLIKAAQGWIDPCPFWDDDGQAYLIHAWAKSRVGFNSILTLHKMSPDGTQILDDGVTIFDGRIDQPTIEGPKLYKRNGYYYIFAPAGGVKNGWQTVLRARQIYGPYEAKIVLEQGSTAINGPHQGAWVETASGEAWFIHFQDRDAYGRLVHLQPMQWSADWPLIGVDFNGNGIGEPVSQFRKPAVDIATAPLSIQTSDEFSQPTLQPQWQWRANWRAAWCSLTTRQGFLRLFCLNPAPVYRNLADLPNILTQKFPAEEFEVIARIEFTPRQPGDRAGLIVIGADYAALTLMKIKKAYWLQQVVGLSALDGNPETVQANVKITQPQLLLKITVSRGAVCHFSYSLDGVTYFPIGSEFQAVKGRWVGAQVGLLAASAAGASSKGYVDCDYFHVIIPRQ